MGQRDLTCHKPLRYYLYTNDTPTEHTMTIKFININTNEVKTITLQSSDYFAPEWIEAVAREVPAIDGWRFAE